MSKIKLVVIDLKNKRMVIQMDFIKWIGFGVLIFLLITHFGIHFFLKSQKKKKRADKKKRQLE